ncbi:MAG: hypothetical protein CML22_06785 [Rheinheimera sp.]|nr:hypothetical protein [Rheinheimera sp.]MBM33988.1 hypothetical protein [Rheinheimera sp.]
MLQINTGKLFVSNEFYENDLCGVLFTNLHFVGGAKLATSAGVLTPASGSSDIYNCYYELHEKVEKFGEGAGVLVSNSVSSYITDFSALLSFYFSCIASPDFNVVKRLMSNEVGVSTRCRPSELVSRFFDRNIVCVPSEFSSFVGFVEKLLSLKRVNYLAVMQSIRTYVTAIHRLSDDLEVSYTLFVAALESLAQAVDEHKPTWNDYEERKRKVVDTALAGAASVDAKKVRDALLEIEHTSLSRRFKLFTQLHIAPSYFREGACDIVNPIAEGELDKALSNAYQARSGYIHNIKPLPRLLTISPSKSEVMTISGSPWLTMQGLTRLARHVIIELVSRQESVEKEEYDYSLEQPNIVRAPMAFQYWGSRIDPSEDSGFKKLQGFLGELAACILSEKTGDERPSVTNLVDVIEDAISKRDMTRKKFRLPYLALHAIYKSSVRSEKTLSPLPESFITELNEPSPISLIFHVALTSVPSWDTDTLEKVVYKYFSTRYHKHAVLAPPIFEAGMYLMLAEGFRKSDNHELAVFYIGKAMQCLPGNKMLMDFEIAYAKLPTEINWVSILLKKAAEEP